MSLSYIECQPVKQPVQLEQIKKLMLTGQWFTKYLLSELTGIELSSVASRIRDLRLEKFGGYIVERQRISNGVFQYRLLNPTTKQGELF